MEAADERRRYPEDGNQPFGRVSAPRKVAA